MTIGHPYNQDDSWVYPDGKLTSYNPQRTTFSFSAAIATGHSGGPVFDENDRLIGMVARVVDATSFDLDPRVENPNLGNFASTGQLARAIRIQPIREKLQTWGILP
jgi:S1-C subfamily serine protease